MASTTGLDLANTNPTSRRSGSQPAKLGGSCCPSVALMRLGEAQRLVQHTNSLNPDMPMLVIDLGTVAQEEGFVKSVETIVAARPWLTTVALTCCGNRDDQTKALFRLRAIPHLHHMNDAECADPASWKQIFRNTFVDRIGAEIEADLIAAEVAARAAAGQVPEAVVFGNADVLELLHLAPRMRKATDLAKLKNVSRVTLWARYKRRYHHNPSELLGTFRCIWSRKLAFMGRSQAQIADFLGQPDTEHHSRVVGTALGLKKSELNEFAYPQTRRVSRGDCDEACRTGYQRGGRRSVVEAPGGGRGACAPAPGGLRRVAREHGPAGGGRGGALGGGAVWRLPQPPGRRARGRVSGRERGGPLARQSAGDAAEPVMPNEHLDPVTVNELVAFVRKAPT